MIGAGGLLYCLAQGIDVPGRIGLAGFNGVELLDGLPRKLATMDACRLEIGRRAAEIIAGKATAGREGGAFPDAAARRHDQVTAPIKRSRPRRPGPAPAPFRIAAPRAGRSASVAGWIIASSLSIGRSVAIRSQARTRSA